MAHGGGTGTVAGAGAAVGGTSTGNGTSTGQVNATTSYYYTPILNSQQTLLRPIMTAQPPLYSPLLPPQQHTYAMPHASPSAGSTYFANLSESMRGGLSDMIPGSSDSLYKEVGHLGRQGQGTGITHSSSLVMPLLTLGSMPWSVPAEITTGGSLQWRDLPIMRWGSDEAQPHYSSRAEGGVL
ncbi:uncharacterized protein LOC119575990 [Penaeus monodon]|uniref:uncharacterized protein LOC119575990 n=1 Tax=Penaeus monodon TaxID=6687 RepID=UPI0018A7E066|nr:uncharacterized protein LOC119575990 [Penaeus monodon]